MSKAISKRTIRRKTKIVRRIPSRSGHPTSDGRESYSGRLKSILSPVERQVFEKLNSPRKIQDFLDTLPINFELKGETLLSPRQLLKEKTAHCIEAALFAAASLAYHGNKPLLMDFQTLPNDEDHVITVFKENNLWGAISKTNHAILRWRDPIYRSPRELAMSYVHEYYLFSGVKSLCAYSRPFDLRRYPPQLWVTTEDEKELRRIEEEFDKSPHFPIAPKKVLESSRRASPTEIKMLDLVEWPDTRENRVG